jgi:hypothetical protein
MSKPLLTLGIIASLSSAGCAGFGVQHSSSLAAPYAAHRGVDSLWESSEEPAPRGVEPSLYAEQELGTLWEATQEAPAGVATAGSGQSRGSDLWNPASVARSWEPRPNQPDQPSQVELRGISQSSRGLWY